VKNIIYVLIFLSIYGPIVGQIRFSYFILTSIFIYQILYFISKKIRVIDKYRAPFYFFLFISICVSMASWISIGGGGKAFLGGLESYFEILAGLIIGEQAIKQKITQLEYRGFVVCVLAPITSLAVLLFLFIPDIIVPFINNYSFGVDNTGQWRFSGFFGLPYYAAVAYFYFIFESILFLYTAKGVRLKLIVFISICLLFVGGMLTVSKTFLVSIPFLVILIIFKFNSFKARLIQVGILLISILFSLYFMFFTILGDEFQGSMKLFIQYYDRGVLQLVLERYSDDNTVISGLLDDSNWNFLGGVGVNAQAIPTDSQFLDVIYRFGYIALAIFIISITYFSLKLSKAYKGLIIVLFVGALGSNVFTPIGLTIVMWGSLAIDLITRKQFFFIRRKNESNTLCSRAS
jgi:hypothetical protein